MGPILLSAILAASKAMRKQARRFFKAKGTGEVSNTVMFNTMFYSFLIECSCVCVLIGFYWNLMGIDIRISDFNVF